MKHTADEIFFCTKLSTNWCKYRSVSDSLLYLYYNRNWRLADAMKGYKYLETRKLLVLEQEEILKTVVSGEH